MASRPDDSRVEQPSAGQLAELAQRDAELEQDAETALTWEQIRASVEKKP